MLVLHASIVVELSLDRIGAGATDALGQEELVAPPLLWSEVPSALHELAFRGEISRALADWALKRFLALADILNSRVVTIDGRLKRGADRLGFVVTPEELETSS